jgi:hypothetical protein
MVESVEDCKCKWEIQLLMAMHIAQVVSISRFQTGSPFVSMYVNAIYSSTLHCLVTYKIVRKLNINRCAIRQLGDLFHQVTGSGS